MPDYSKGKIYTIRCRTDNTLIYIGSTISSLSKRWGQHKGAIISKKYGLYNCIEINGGFENWYIELYENYPCESKEQLFKKEGEIIRLIGTLNSLISGRTRKEYREENREELLEKKKIYREENKEELLEKGKIYYIENKEEILEKGKIYREEHKEEISEQRKIYREEHKEEILEKGKIYREENKDKITEKKKIYREEHKEEIIEKGKIYYIKNKEEILDKMKIKYNCACGSTIPVCRKARHERSIKHTNFII